MKCSKTTAIIFVFIMHCFAIVRAIRCFQGFSTNTRFLKTCQSSLACYVKAFVDHRRPSLLPLVLESLRFGCIENSRLVRKCNDTLKSSLRRPYQISCCDGEDFCNLPSTFRNFIHRSKQISSDKKYAPDRGMASIQMASVIMPSVSIVTVVLATSIILYKIYKYRKAVKKCQSGIGFQFPVRSKSKVSRAVLSHHCEPAIKLSSGETASYYCSISSLLKQLEKHYNYCEYGKNLTFPQEKN